MTINCKLSDRKKDLLNEIIDDFVSSGIPVASVKIASKGLMGLSSATIRSAMSELEDMGFLTHPHTSAGRIPTEKAYRYYVDRLLKVKKVTSKDRKFIEAIFSRDMDLSTALQESSKLLSGLCSQMSIIMRPSFSNMVFKHIEFVSLSKDKLLAVLITKTGVVVNKIFKVKEEMTAGDIEKINNYLNSILEGLTIVEVKKKIVEEMRKEKDRYDDLLAKALKLGAAFVQGDRKNDFYVEGASNVLGCPEFSDVERMKGIFKTFEEKSRLLDILDRAINSKDPGVWIGNESGIEEMEGLSIVTSTYGACDRTLGCIGILGPTRMDYSRIIPVVQYTASKLSNIIMEV